MNESIKKELATITPRIDVETHCIFGYFMYICPTDSPDEAVRLDFTSNDLPTSYHWILQALACVKINEYAKDFWHPLQNYLTDEILEHFYKQLLHIYFIKYGNTHKNTQLSEGTPGLE